MNIIFKTVTAAVMMGAVAAPAFAETKTPFNTLTCAEYANGEGSMQHEVLDAIYAHLANIGTGRSGADVVGTAAENTSTATEAGDNPNGKTDESRTARDEDVAALIAQCKANPEMLAMHAVVSMPVNDQK